jgi:hypothetical protein
MFTTLTAQSTDIDKLNDIRAELLGIYAYIALAILRRTGRLDDNDEKFVKFKLRLTETLEGTDALGDWDKPEYICNRIVREETSLRRVSRT